MKSATHQFIEDAIAGGWKPNGSWFGSIPTDSDFHTALLNPLAWQAVGKTRGWEPPSPADVTAGECEYLGEWGQRQIDFILELQDGKTIEEALAAIQDGV